jgi:hypothetical protein
MLVSSMPAGCCLGRDKKVRLQYTSRTSLVVDVASKQRIGCLGEQEGGAPFTFVNNADY